MVVLRYKVPPKPIRPENPEEGGITYDSSSPRYVKVVIEHEGGRRTIVDKTFIPGRLLEYPLRISGRGIAKIYVDDMLIETKEL
jgi:hypothetical protein